jgi:xanthine dehydrogenase accessory factor
MNIFAEAKSKIEDKNSILFLSDYQGGRISRRIVDETSSPKFSFDKAADDSFRMTETIMKEGRMIVLGGGHIALPLTRMAIELGYSVTLFDDRPKFTGAARFPEILRAGGELICDSFDNVAKRITLHHNDVVVIITRGHMHDRECLAWALSGKMPSYVGMIGSRRRVGIVKDMVAAEIADKSRLDKVFTPIGLRIGAVTPAEIAVAILAEIVGEKRKGKDHSIAFECFDINILNRLAEGSESGCGNNCLITIVSAAGSTPRSIGAKMLISQDGGQIGSIGGGCSEAGIIDIARRVMLNSGYALETVNMADTAEDDGMVCGGEMEVIIEMV